MVGAIRIGMLLLMTALLAACAGSGAPAPSDSPVPSAGGGPVTTEGEAITAVIAREPRLQGIMPKDPDMIGQSSWYVVTPASGVGAFLVEVTVGWGDCPAGCIDEHTWRYAVAPDGTVTLQRETGSDVPSDAWPAPKTGILVTAVAGPTCSVETVPPDPACAPRPVQATKIDVVDDNGRIVAQQGTDASGSAFFEVPPGAYLVKVADAGDSFMAAPEPQDVQVVPGAMAAVTFAFDTGIR